ncbi:MAG: hypothetical protein AAB660_00505 [Patescibacteria group bacterium]
MKKLLVLIVIIIAGLGLYYFERTKGTTSINQNIKIQPSVEHPDATNATFIFEDGSIKLKNGKANTNIAGSSISVDTNLIEEPIAYADINGDGKNDTIVILSQDGGGSGIFVYLAAYVSGNVEYKGSNAVFIGDRVSPKSITAGKDGIITFEYLDRNENDPMASEPTILKKTTFVWKNRILEEI